MLKKSTILTMIMAAALLAGCDSSSTEPGQSAPIRISSPANNSIISDPVTVTASAGQGYTFVRVDFFIDGDSVWSDALPPFQYYWNVYVYSGTTQHAILAVGYTADSSYTSATVNVSVSFVSGFAFVSAYVPNSAAAYGVSVYQNALFAAVGGPGLEVIDITNKSAPRYVSRYDSPGLALKSAVSYPYVFIADYSEGVTRADFSNPDSLIQRGIYTSQAAVNDVAISANYLIVAENDGVSVVGYSNPVNMNFISKVDMTGQDQPQFVVARGDTAFVAAWNKFYIIDCTNPAAPQIVSTYTTAGLAQCVALDGDLAFVADGPEGVFTLSIADPTSPVETARYNTGEYMTSVDASNLTLFAGGSSSGGVYALDYSQPDTLVLADQFDTGNGIWQLLSTPPFLYAATSGNVNILRYFR